MADDPGSRLTDGAIHEALSTALPRRRAGEPVTVLGAGSDDLGSGRRFLAIMAEGGWMVPVWPSEHGGRGATEDEAVRIASALDDYEVADLYPFGVGLSLVGPILLEHGTDAQRDRWLLPIADGAEIWCQMFSEPDAGSDLANAGTRAVRDGDEWVLGGSKVWTSRAHYSQWGLCLARSDVTVPKHRGLTMFAVDMSDTGVDARPLVQMNGDRHFSEVFLTDVRVPDADRIGDEGSGWGLAVQVLALERAGLSGRAFGGGGDEDGLPGWLRKLQSAGLLDHPVRRQRAVAAYTLHRVSQLTARRARAAAEAGRPPGPEGSGAKLRSVIAFRARADLVKDAMGASGMLDGEGHIEFLTAPSMSIRGGTDEIQRNIIGERVLDLPSEPRVDKDVAYSELRRSVPAT